MLETHGTVLVQTSSKFAQCPSATCLHHRLHKIWCGLRHHWEDWTLKLCTYQEVSPDHLECRQPTIHLHLPNPCMSHSACSDKHCSGLVDDLQLAGQQLLNSLAYQWTTCTLWSQVWRLVPVVARLVVRWSSMWALNIVAWMHNASERREMHNWHNNTFHEKDHDCKYIFIIL